MELNQKVLIKNLTEGRVGINLPDLRLNRIWEQKGAVKPIDFEILAQAIYDPGVENLFKQGILYIEDMEAKIALGLEPEEAKKPQNILVMTDQDRVKFLTVSTINEFKKVLSDYPLAQIEELARFAIEREFTDINKCSLLKKITGIDVIKVIQMNKLDKEE